MCRRKFRSQVSVHGLRCGDARPVRQEHRPPSSAREVRELANGEGGGKKQHGFTLIEMMVTMTIFAAVFGIAAMLYAYATRRTTDGLDRNNLIGQVTYIDQYLERTIENASSCAVSGSGSSIQFSCTMPQTGATTDDIGEYATYTPVSCSNGVLHWGTGITHWFYWSNNTGSANSGVLSLLFGGTGGNELWLCDVNGNGSINSGTTKPAWNYTQGTTSSTYKFYLIDTFSASVNSSSHSVTYTIGGSVLNSTNAPIGSSTDTQDSHSFSITRTVYWRNSVN